MHRALVLAAVACGGGEPERFVLDDEGSACVVSARADEPASVALAPEPCKSCYGSEFEASCTVTFDGSTLRVTSEASYLFENTNEPCAANCALWVVQCATEDPVPAGTYDVTFGDLTVPITVPLESGGSVCVP